MTRRAPGPGVLALALLASGCTSPDTSTAVPGVLPEPTATTAGSAFGTDPGWACVGVDRGTAELVLDGEPDFQGGSGSLRWTPPETPRWHCAISVDDGPRLSVYAATTGRGSTYVGDNLEAIEVDGAGPEERLVEVDGLGRGYAFSNADRSGVAGFRCDPALPDADPGDTTDLQVRLDDAVEGRDPVADLAALVTSLAPYLCTPAATAGDDGTG